MERVELALARYKARVESALSRWLPAPPTVPQRLHEAMCYATLDGGKRIRAALVYATGESLSVRTASLDGPACAVELIHAYSLVHDDLPAMDNDELRRGKPSCHKAFDEATALLAGDALQSLAFQVLAEDAQMRASPERRLKMIATLAQAAGSLGMVGGQALDLAATGAQITLPELENIHIHKTGALIRAAVALGVLSSDSVDEDCARRLDRYAKCLGLAFQIQDDILDASADTETLGKRSGADRRRNKPTYPALLGPSEARRQAAELRNAALESLAGLGDNMLSLRLIAEYVVQRAY